MVGAATTRIGRQRACDGHRAVGHVGHAARSRRSSGRCATHGVPSVAALTSRNWSSNSSSPDPLSVQQAGRLLHGRVGRRIDVHVLDIVGRHHAGLAGDLGQPAGRAELGSLPPQRVVRLARRRELLIEAIELELRLRQSSLERGRGQHRRDDDRADEHRDARPPGAVVAPTTARAAATRGCRRSRAPSVAANGRPRHDDACRCRGVQSAAGSAGAAPVDGRAPDASRRRGIAMQRRPIESRRVTSLRDVGSMRSATRRRALRARGFAACSSADGVRGTLRTRRTVCTASHTHGSSGGHDAAAGRRLAHALLDDAVLARVVRQHRDPTADLGALDRSVERAGQHVELLVQLDAHRLERALGRMPARAPRGCRDRTDDDLGQTSGGLDRAGRDDGAGDASRRTARRRGGAAPAPASTSS